MKRLLAFLAIIFLANSAFGQQDSVLICNGSRSHAYHLRICQGLDRCTTALERITKADAIKLGRDACDFCYPTKVNSGYGYKSRMNSSSSSVSNQCLGTTKKNLRCSRMVKGGSYCWQHGG